MNKFSLALVAAAAALAIAPSALATTITTGIGPAFIGSPVAQTGVVNINGTIGGPPNFTATVSEWVYKYNAAGDLAFEYTVTNTSPTTDEVLQLATNYGAWADPALLLDAVSGGAVTGTYDSQFGTIDVDFTGGLKNANNTSTFILYTDALGVATGTVTLQDTATGGQPMLVPAPEPSNLLLLGTGLLGLAFVAFRKAKSSGMVLSM